MAAQKGKDLLVKIHDGTGFVTVAGLRSRRIAFNAETVDITHAESAGRWRDVMSAAAKRAAPTPCILTRDTIIEPSILGSIDRRVICLTDWQ